MALADRFTAARVAPCMVQYKIAEGGILKVKQTTETTTSLFKLTVRCTGVDQPEIKTYNPADDGKLGQPCGARWDSRDAALRPRNSNTEATAKVDLPCGTSFHTPSPTQGESDVTRDQQRAC